MVFPPAGVAAAPLERFAADFFCDRGSGAAGVEVRGAVVDPAVSWSHWSGKPRPGEPPMLRGGREFGGGDVRGMGWVGFGGGAFDCSDVPLRW